MLYLYIIIYSIIPFKTEESLKPDFLKKAIHFRTTGKVDSAYKYIIKEIKNDQSAGNKEKWLKSNLILGDLFLQKRQMDSTRLLFQMVYNKSKKHKFRLYQANSLAGLGRVASSNGSFLKALSYFSTAKRIYARKGINRQIVSLNIDEVRIYQRLGFKEKSIKKLHQTLIFVKKHNLIKFLPGIYMQISQFYRNTQQTDSSVHYLSLMRMAVSKIPDEQNKFRFYIERGRVLLQNKEFKEAVVYYRKAENIALNKKDTLMLVNILSWKANALMQSGDSRKAFNIANDARKISIQLGKVFDFETLYHTLIFYEKKIGNFEKALNFHEELSKLRSKHFSVLRQKNLDELNIKYRTQIRKQSILALKNQSLQKDLKLKQKKIQLNTLVGGSSTLLLLLSLLIWFYFYRRKKDKKLQEQIISYHEKEKEAAAAQSLVLGSEKERQRIARELHDSLGVVLSSASIYFSGICRSGNSLTESDSFSLIKAKELLDTANKEVRRISHNMMPVVLNKFGLWAALEDFTDDISEGSAITIKLKGKKLTRMLENTEIMIFRIVQELVNNTLKHASASRIDISFKSSNGLVLMEYKDNGKGFDKEQINSKNGMGLMGIKSRVEFLKGKLFYQSFPGKGVGFTISFPYTQA